jgi:tRNA(His) guanylyltransferase
MENPESKDKIGDRLKEIEGSYEHYFEAKKPVILRLDGRSFSSLTRKSRCEKPVDIRFRNAMWDTAKYLCEEIAGAEVAYTQSDEITILVQDYKNPQSTGWFGYRQNKIESVSAALASVRFLDAYREYFGTGAVKDYPTFDCRSFQVNREDVNSVFYWRQLDCVRNSKSTLAQANFSHNELHKKSADEMVKMLALIGVHWDQTPVSQQRGVCIVKEQYQAKVTNPKTLETVFANRSRWVVDENIPLFHPYKLYLEPFINCDQYVNE